MWGQINIQARIELLLVETTELKGKKTDTPQTEIIDNWNNDLSTIIDSLKNQLSDLDNQSKNLT